MGHLTGLEIRSTITEEGKLTVGLEEVTLDPPGPDEVIIRVEAAPINPSDLGLLLGPADVSTMEQAGNPDRPTLTFSVPPASVAAVRKRLGLSLAVGTEGAGTVIDAGDNAKLLVGRKVAAMGGGMYAQYRKLNVREVVALPDGTSAADGAAMFVNPLTALSFVETMQREGHSALVHTAAASNLGQMLQKICLADGIPLVNIVRNQAQANILESIGAQYVLNSETPDFRSRLVEVLAETGATLAFDAVGGGRLGSDILQAMEQVANRATPEYSRYGSEVFKQLYLYGSLDRSPTMLNRMAFGFEWSVAGHLLLPWLKKLSQPVIQGLHDRIVAELTTTFGSHYSATIGLVESLQPDVLLAYERKATGEKFLIDPRR